MWKQVKYHIFQLFKDYYIHWVEATRIHRSGRASGGCLYGFKKDIKRKFKLEFATIHNVTVLCTNLNGSVFYLIPSYLNCTKWKTEAESFETFLKEINPENFCILGDLNARIGEEQLMENRFFEDFAYISGRRRSKDNTINTNGRKLLQIIEDIGGIVLNGRTTGDTEGNFSFCGIMGSSVIDYNICSHSFLRYVEDFSIDMKIFSDHMPLHLEIKVPNQCRTSDNERVSICKLHWKDKFKIQYRQNLTTLCNGSHFSADLLAIDMIDTVISKIKQSNVVKERKSVFEPRQKWFDWGCFRLQASIVVVGEMKTPVRFGCIFKSNLLCHSILFIYYLTN